MHSWGSQGNSGLQINAGASTSPGCGSLPSMPGDLLPAGLGAHHTKEAPAGAMANKCLNIKNNMYFSMFRLNQRWRIMTPKKHQSMKLPIESSANASGESRMKSMSSCGSVLCW